MSTAPAPGPLPDEQGSRHGPPDGRAVGFLLSQLGLVVSRQFAEVIAATGLEPREFALLRAIAGAEGSTQNAMSDRLGIPASTLVAVVDHLEAGGFLERHTHPLDRRSRTLHVTEQGRATLASAMRLAMGYEQQLCGDLAPEERAVLLDLLDRLASRVGVTEGVHPGLTSGASDPSCGPLA